MAGKSALPLLALAGAAVVLGSKKKKKKKAAPSEDPAAAGQPYGEPATTTPYPGVPKPTPKKPTVSKIPAGDPPNPKGPGEWGDYDHGFWDSPQKIIDKFAELGYQTPADPHWGHGESVPPTMNNPGPDKELGGDNDVPSPSVRLFQQEYNAVSRSKTFGANMGGLADDGLVGPKTLNGLKFVLDNLKGKKWKSDIVQGAALKGFKA